MNTYQHDEFSISADKSKLDTKMIHEYLSQRSYWAKDIAYATVVKSIEHSFCAGVYHHAKQVGFARVVTDFTRIAWLCDVFILEEYRGQGLSKRLVEYLIAYPEMQEVQAWMLATADAHGLYAKFGFAPLEHPEKFMRRTRTIQ